MSTLGNRKKFGPQRSGMTHAAWRAAQAVGRRFGWRWFFDRSMAKTGVNCTARNHSTFYVGRNKAKRQRRELDAQFKGPAKTPKGTRLAVA